MLEVSIAEAAGKTALFIVAKNVYEVVFVGYQHMIVSKKRHNLVQKLVETISRRGLQHLANLVHFFQGLSVCNKIRLFQHAIMLLRIMFTASRI